MKSTLLILLLGMITSQAAHAQINIQSDEGNVSIGSDGIKIRQGGQSVNLNPGGITIKQPNQGVKIQSSGGRAHSSRGSVKTKTTSARVTNSSSVSHVNTTAVTGLSLDQRVTNLELQAYGKKTTGVPFIERVKKLENDTLGAEQSGTITVRISKLATALGVSEGTKTVTTVKKSITQSSPTQSIEIGAPGQTVDISSSGTSVKMNVNSGGGVSGRSIVLDTSGYDGTVACNGDNVILNASSCTIKFTGAINNLVLNGSSNDITCDTVRHVQVNGSANDVKWSRSANPSVANAGSANTLKSR